MQIELQDKALKVQELIDDLLSKQILLEEDSILARRFQEEENRVLGRRSTRPIQQRPRAKKAKSTSSGFNKCYRLSEPLGSVLGEAEVFETNLV